MVKEELMKKVEIEKEKPSDEEINPEIGRDEHYPMKKSLEELIFHALSLSLSSSSLNQIDREGDEDLVESKEVGGGFG
ncbi:hypothetical protein QVD17_28181 [Tagetes erecta]|uniref:Uncharacterized protein n=1 Tax=Tagetes erecta TaxID=13708 RepID=A0AAD8NK90_TARER|nr:hypothetical protein QVD17_28180 [Tagetes erecta]KAK1419025.1 hypothetical protein QVD17_28181 [Tagetes erecta]